MNTVLVFLFLAQESSEPAQRPITDITVEGLRRIDADAARAHIGSQISAPLNADKLTEDLRAVWQTGLFEDVQVFREPHEAGFRVVFVVRERPSVREVRFEGHDALSQDDIKEVVDIKANTVLDVEKVKQNVEKIRDLYLDKGYYLADVHYELRQADGGTQDAVDETGVNRPNSLRPTLRQAQGEQGRGESPPFHDVVVSFRVVENEKVMVRQISFVGNEAIDTETIKGVLQTREGDELSWLTSSGTYKEEFFQVDLLRIQALYYDQGYVAVQVGEPRATISQDQRYISISIPISEGPRFTIGSLGFSGQVEVKDGERVIVDEAKLRAQLTVTQGEFFNRTKLFEDMQRITDVYRDQGYAYANVTPNTETKDAIQEILLTLEVDPGSIVSIERIDIVGNTRTRDKVIRRELRLFEGERYSASGIKESEARVTQLGFFEKVDIRTDKGSAEELMKVTVEVTEKSTGTFNVGVGFSSVETLIGTAQVSQNNFLGNGQLLSLSAQLSFGEFSRQMAVLQFFEPYFLDTRWSLGVNAYSTQNRYPEFDRNSTGAAPSFGYLLTPDLRLSLGYRLEHIEISTDSLVANQGPALDQLNLRGLNSELSLSLTYDTRDNRLFPASGHYHTLNIEASDPRLGSAVELEYQRYQVSLRHYYPLPWHFVVQSRLTLGLITGGALGIPISERFFPGGIYTVRGFEPRGLGPTLQVLQKGDPFSATSLLPVGGNKQAIVNLELEFPILQEANIRGVIFGDAGNAYGEDESFLYVGQETRPKGFWLNSQKSIDLPFGLYYSVGFGIRWFSPVGPLRFEWGIPLTKRSQTDKDINFEFTIGNIY